MESTSVGTRSGGYAEASFGRSIANPTSMRCLQTIQNHCQYSQGLAPLPNGRLAAPSESGPLEAHVFNIKVWDAASGKCIRVLDGHQKTILALAGLEGEKLASGGFDNTVKIWDLQTGNCLHNLPHDHTISAIIDAKQERICSSAHLEIRIWNVRTARCMGILKGHSGCVHALVLLPNGNLVSGGYDCKIKIWDLDKSSCIHSLEDHYTSVTSLALLSDMTLVSGAQGKMIKIWNLESRFCIATMEGHQNGITALAMVGDQTVAVAETLDNVIRIMDIQNRKAVHTLEGHSGEPGRSGSVETLVRLYDGNLASLNKGEIKIWGVRFGQVAIAQQQVASSPVATSFASVQFTSLSSETDRDGARHQLVAKAPQALTQKTPLKVARGSKTVMISCVSAPNGEELLEGLGECLDELLTKPFLENCDLDGGSLVLTMKSDLAAKSLERFLQSSGLNV